MTKIEGKLLLRLEARLDATMRRFSQEYKLGEMRVVGISVMHYLHDEKTDVTMTIRETKEEVESA